MSQEAGTEVTAEITAAVAAARVERERDERSPILIVRAAAGDAAWLTDALLEAGEQVVLADASSADELDHSEQRAMLLSWVRAALFDDAVLFVVGLDAVSPRRRLELSRQLQEGAAAPAGPFLILQSRDLTIEPLDKSSKVRVLDAELPARLMRAQAWRRKLGDAAKLSDAEFQALASTFGFEREQIATAVALAIDGAGDKAIDVKTLRAAACEVARASTPQSVRRLETTLNWNDLVLPPALEAELRAIPAQVELGAKVWEEWGFSRRIPYGQGVAALFSGPSGTGKTMAAQIIAGEMGVPLFHVDLAQTVSKYIGETEKALGRIFDAAEGAGAVLLFDEADALFGKRSEVRDAHDRYANIEVAYLLQRMEEYRGLAILTTNAKQNVDPAFLRRLRFVVDFPVPDAEDRLKICKGMFPGAAPLAKDVDLLFLAERVALTGGNIQQIALRAAFDAASDEGTITMAHVVAATRRELNKLGMQSTERFIIQVAPAAGTGP